MLGPLGPALSAAAQKGLINLGPAEPFSFEGLAGSARALAGKPWQPAQAKAAEILQHIDYDAYQQIRFKRAASLKLGESGHAPVQLFHLGQLFMEPVRIHQVQGWRGAGSPL